MRLRPFVFMHFTGVRYGVHDDHGTHGEPCSECVQILRNVTLVLGWFGLPNHILEALWIAPGSGGLGRFGLMNLRTMV